MGLVPSFFNRRRIIVAGCLCAAMAAVTFSIIFWEWLNGAESGSTTIRNIALVAAGLVALPLAIWRGIVAERQATTARQGLLNERYQKGAEMLGSGVLSVRLGVIYALQRLAEDCSGTIPYPGLCAYSALSCACPRKTRVWYLGRWKLRQVLNWDFDRMWRLSSRLSTLAPSREPGSSEKLVSGWTCGAPASPGHNS